MCSAFRNVVANRFSVPDGRGSRWPVEVVIEVEDGIAADNADPTRLCAACRRERNKMRRAAGRAL